MKNLNTQTLMDIGRFQDKAMKTASFYSKSEFPCFTDQISKLESYNSEVEVLDAAEKDINKTATFISKTSQLLRTVNQKGEITAAKGSPKVEDLFGDNYNRDRQEITLGSVVVKVGDDIERAVAKEMLMTGIFGLTSEQFTTIKKQTKKVYTIKEKDIETREDAIMYVGEYPLRKKHKPILDKIRDIAKDAEDTRARYVDGSQDNKYQKLNQIDRNITGTRAMIDSIIKASTHVSSDVVHQEAKPHAPAKVKRLRDLVDKSDYISDVEIDPDVDVNKVIDLINQIQGLKLNISSDFTLKVRKLGNYNASGLCIPSANIVSVDVEKPSSLIHELTHLVDLTSEEIKESTQRETLINKFRQKLDDKAQKGYLGSDQEIIARLGEISYIFNKYDYQGESFEDFARKIENQDINDESMCVVKNLSTYVANKGIYFGIGDEDRLNSEDMMDIKKYFQSYWGIDKPYIEQNEVYTRVEVEKYRKRIKPKTPKSAFTPTVFSNITEETIVDSYEFAKESDFINSNEFAEEILINMQSLHRSRKRIRGEEVSRQFRTVNNMYRSILETGTNDDKVESLISLAKHTGDYYLGSAGTIMKHLENLPIEEGKELYNEMTYKNSQGFEYSKKDAKDATAYLNDYGKKVARKMLVSLQVDLVREMDVESFNKVLTRIKPNTKSFYYLVFMRQAQVSDEDMVPLRDFLNDRGWLSLFKFPEAEQLGRRLNTRLGSIMSVRNPMIKGDFYDNESEIATDKASIIIEEFKKYTYEKALLIDLLNLDNIDSIIDDEINKDPSLSRLSDQDARNLIKDDIYRTYVKKSIGENAYRPDKWTVKSKIPKQPVKKKMETSESKILPDVPF